MRLILTLAGGGAVPEKDKTKTLSTGSISIGRAAGNDWVLPDPDRSLSKTHCTITERNGRFILVDSSTNGIFINGSSQPTERDSQTVLNQGDKLSLGDYVIAVSAMNDGPAPDSDLGMDYRPVVPGAPAFQAVGGAVMPSGPLDIDPLDDPFGRQGNPGFQHPVAPVAVQPRGLDPFDQIQSRAGSAGGIGPDVDMFSGVQQSNDWQGASRPDHTPVISQAVPAMRIASAPPMGDIDFDALIGDLPGAQGAGQGGAHSIPGGADPFGAPDPFGGGMAQPVGRPPAMPQPGAGFRADPFGSAPVAPGFPAAMPGAGFGQAGPPPGFNAADFLADLNQPAQPDPFAAPPTGAGQPTAFAPPRAMPAPGVSVQGAASVQGASVHAAPGQPPASPPLPVMPAQPVILQPAMPVQPPPFAPAAAALVAEAAVPEASTVEAFAPLPVQPHPTRPSPDMSAPVAAQNPFDEAASAAMTDGLEVDPLAVTTRQAPAMSPAPAAVSAPPAPQAAGPTPAAIGAPAGADARAAFRAFLEGAGVAGAQIDDSDPEASLRAAGAVFSAMTAGLREVLISRAAIKSEMRIEQTMIAAQGNNALKFSVAAEDAVAAMLTPKRRGYMAPLAAAQEALSDIKDHEIAVMAGVQTALMTLLRRFDPTELEKRLNLGGLSAVLPGARKSRYWDAFRQVYGDITREAEDDFQSVFGRPFAKAYTEQTRKE
jgi:type VI secretion system protein